MSEPRTRIDDAIDRAVRDIIRHDPPAGFRRRVLSRLHAPVHRAFLFPALATAAAAIAVFAIARVVVRDAPQHPVNRPPEAAARVPGHPTVPPVAMPQPRMETPSASTRNRRAPRQEPIRTATFGPREGRISAANLRATRPSSSAADEAAAAEPAASALPPIAVTALAPLPPLEIPPIVVAPIQIPRVQLAPLSPPR